MVTRKKKTEAQKFDEQVVMKEEYYDLEPTIVKGTHLTVTTFPDGKTMLEWDDEALLKEVREALKTVEVPKTKTKRKLTKEKQ